MTGLPTIVFCWIHAWYSLSVLVGGLNKKIFNFVAKVWIFCLKLAWPRYVRICRQYLSNNNLSDNHVKNNKYGCLVSISILTGECAAEKLKNVCSSSLWTSLHQMVILRSVTSVWSPLGNILEGQAHPNVFAFCLSSNQIFFLFFVTWSFFVFAFRWFRVCHWGCYVYFSNSFQFKFFIILTFLYSLNCVVVQALQHVIRPVTYRCQEHRHLIISNTLNWIF